MVSIGWYLGCVKGQLGGAGIHGGWDLTNEGTAGFTQGVWTGSHLGPLGGWLFQEWRRGVLVFPNAPLSSPWCLKYPSPLDPPSLDPIDLEPPDLNGLLESSTAILARVWAGCFQPLFLHTTHRLVETERGRRKKLAIKGWVSIGCQ